MEALPNISEKSGQQLWERQEEPKWEKSLSSPPHCGSPITNIEKYTLANLEMSEEKKMREVILKI